MSGTPTVVFYQYEQSPFAQKIARILTLKDIKHTKVEVARMPPRPELSEELGIPYRRIPVLAIGRDVFIDTSLISTALEKYFPESKGHPTIFPKRNGSDARDTGLIKAFVSAYADRTFFTLASLLLPWESLPEAFVKDRSAYKGTTIDPKRITAMQPAVTSTMMAHLNLLEEQLSDGREWLMDTVSPSLADIAIDFVLVWTQKYPTGKLLHDPKQFPHVMAWLSRMESILAQKQEAGAAQVTKMTGKEAGQALVSSEYVAPLEFDEKQGKLLGISEGATVSVTPEDTGRDSPTSGILVGLTLEEVVLETSGGAGTVHVHFPRIGFTIQPASKL